MKPKRTTKIKSERFGACFFAFLILLVQPCFVQAQAYINVGSYTGNGSDNRAINDVGFQPDVVIIKGETAQVGVIKTSTMSGDLTKPLVGNTALTPNYIQSLDTYGFTVGDDAPVNSNGVIYHWVAFKAALGEMKVGSYTGTGIDNTLISGVGFNPSLIFIMSASANAAVLRPNTSSNTFDFTNGAGFSGVGTHTSDGFYVRTDARVNSSGTIYHYIAWTNVTGRQNFNGHWGDNTDNRNVTGLGFQPYYLIIKDVVSNQDTVFHSGSMGFSTDATMYYRSSANLDADRIQALLSDGYQVGNDTDVNRNTSDFYATFAWGRSLPTMDIDCDFSDWTGGWPQRIIDDQGGPDDFATQREDITRVGITSNLTDTFYVLFGFDDLSFGNSSSAAVLFDTDLDLNINFALLAEVDASNNWTVELYACDDSLPYGCGNATLSKTYTSPSDYCVGTAAGPWNNDTFVEVALPFADLTGFIGGNSIFAMMASYRRGDLTRPRDSIFADIYDRLNYDTTDGTSEIIDNVITSIISGTVYSDEGATAVAAGMTVQLLVNGATVATDVTDVNGTYFFLTSVSAGDAILVYIDNDASYKGSTVTVFNGLFLGDLDIYAGHVITRHDNGGVLTIADMAAAKGSYMDSDILYSVSGSDLTVSGSGTEFYLPAGYAFAPGGNITTPNMKSLGTFAPILPQLKSFSFAAATGTSINGNKPTNTAPGDLLIAIMATDGNGRTLGAPAGWTPITNNIGVNHTSRSWYKVAGASEPATYTFTVSASEEATLGILRFSGQDPSTPIHVSATNTGTSISPTAPAVTTAVNDTLILRYYGADDNDYTGDDSGYPPLHTGIYRRQSGGETHQGAAYMSQVSPGSTGTAAFSQNLAEEWSAATIAIAPATAPVTLDINGTLTISGGSFTAPGPITIAGNFDHSGGTFTHNAGTVTLDGSGQSILGSTAFFNLTKSVISADTLTFQAGSTQAFNGTVTLQGASGNLLRLRSSSPGTQWNFTVNAGATKAISYVDVQDSNASGSDASQKTIDPSASIDSGNNVAWFDLPFSYRKPITIDRTRVGASCSANLTDFPVLISIQNDNNLKTTANGGRVTSTNGYDLIFRGTDLNQLDHEIERYDGVSGTLVAWVRIPSLSISTDTVIYMDYGNSSITSPPANPTQVWDTNYVGVWHLSESPNDGVAGHVDSTGNNGAGTPRNFQDGGGGTTNATGKIGGADYFAGDDDYVDCGNNANLNVNYVTVELWLNVNSWVSDAGILAKGDNTYRQYWMWTYGGAGSFEIDEAPYQNNVWALSLGIWEHLVLTYDGSNVTTYRNGVQENQYPQTTGTIDATAQPLLFGYLPSYYYFDGSLDEVRISRVPRDACWIETEYNNMNWPNKTESGASGFVAIGAEQASPPTAVGLLSLKATGAEGNALVSWTTAQEINNFGFHVYRSETVGGAYARITDRLIPGLSFSVRGREYSYVDRNVTQGRLYYYKLEDIDMDGTRTMHGPVCVDWDRDGIADDWEIKYGLNTSADDSGLDPDGDGLTNIQEYSRGTDPLRVDTDGDGLRDTQEEYVGTVSPGLMRGVEVIASDANGMTLELRTESFESVVVDVVGVSYQRLRVPEYLHGYTDVIGKPELPVKGMLLDLPAGKGGLVSIESVERRELSNYWIYPVPDKVVSGEGELATVSEVFFIDEAAYRVNSFYPDVVARAGETYDYRGQKKLQVFFNPFSFNPVTKDLIQYTRIRVRVAYIALAETVPAVKAGVPLTPAPSGLASAMVWVPPAPASAYKMPIAEEGIYRLTSAWLNSRGVSVSDWSQVRVYNLGQEIPIYQGADYVEFYGTPPSEGHSKYTKHNVYWLTTSGGSGTPLRMGTIDGTPGPASVPTTHVFTVRMEEDREYLGEAPGAESLDRWVHGTFAYGSAFGGGPVDYAVTLPGVGGTQRGQVSVLMCGLTELGHDVEISVNGVSLGKYQWRGLEFYEVSFNEVALVDGLNTLTLTCLGDEDAVALDWVEVAYPRKYEASGNLLKLTHNAGYRYQIANFTNNTLQAYDITTPTDVKRITGATVSPTNPYTLAMEPTNGTGERTYIALSSSATKTPVSITRDTAGNLSGASNGADYILITHRDLGWDGGGSAQPWLANLKAHREAQGLRVKVVNVEDIYDEFSYGIVSPQGIKDFLGYTYQNWVSPAPQYVLLVGDSAYDPKDNYGLGAINVVPTYLARTPFMGESLTDEWYVRISGNDAIADMDIGRLPAATTAQAEMMVNKILTYETTPVSKTWERNTLLVADNQVEGYEALFELMNEDVAGILPKGMNAPFREYLNDYVHPNDLTQSMISRLNVDGALILNYSGHGSVQVWATESIFSTGDVATLSNSGNLPFVVAMGCLNGFFGYPEAGWAALPSLAEVLLRNNNNGAVAAFMSTGMTDPEGQRVLDQALFEGIFKRDYRTLGRAISYAKQELVANSVALGETGKTFLLFGDPAMRLKVPLPTAPTAPVGQVSGQSVTLTWGASTDANGGAVAGYNVYRSTTPNGPYTKLNAALATGTQYTDSTAQSGTYYYVIRSVDSDGDESPGTLEMTVTVGARSIGDSAGGSGGSGGGGGCFVSSML